MESEIYSPPKSNVENREPIKKGWKTSRAIFYGILSIYIYFVLGNVVSQFNETFGAFGADLPWLTRLVIDAIPIYKWPGYFSVLILVAFVASLLSSKEHSIMRKAVKYNFLLVILVFFICIVAMYLPIITIGSAV